MIWLWLFGNSPHQIILTWLFVFCMVIHLWYYGYEYINMILLTRRMVIKIWGRNSPINRSIYNIGFIGEKMYFEVKTVIERHQCIFPAQKVSLKLNDQPRIVFSHLHRKSYLFLHSPCGELCYNIRWFTNLDREGRLARVLVCGLASLK